MLIMRCRKTCLVFRTFRLAFLLPKTYYTDKDIVRAKKYSTIVFQRQKISIFSLFDVQYLMITLWKKDNIIQTKFFRINTLTLVIIGWRCNPDTYMPSAFRTYPCLIHSRKWPLFFAIRATINFTYMWNYWRTQTLSHISFNDFKSS